MVFPYPDDLLYQQSMEGSDARYQYYNPVAATPRGFFDGVIQGSISGWEGTLNNLVTTDSPLKITPSGYWDGNSITLEGEVTRTGDVPDNDLVMHFVAVEDIFYAGRNGVTDHKQVMRKMFPTPDGQSFSINLNETKSIGTTFITDPIWDLDSLSFVLFVQSSASKTVYQSATIAFSELLWVSADEKRLFLEEFVLEQNYPNPFNPSTRISFTIPESGFTTLKVYNVLGNNVATLINRELTTGAHTITFDAKDLPGGVYFYTLKSNNFYETKKMLLLK
jgi:hypothetical protein